MGTSCLIPDSCFVSTSVKAFDRAVRGAIDAGTVAPFVAVASELLDPWWK